MDVYRSIFSGEPEWLREKHKKTRSSNTMCSGRPFLHRAAESLISDCLSGSMNFPDDLTNNPLIEKRRRVGMVAGVCLASAFIVFLIQDLQNAWASALLRIGLVLGALWLALPTRTRPAAWARLSRWKLAGIVVFAVLLPRLKMILPILLIGMLIGWVLRPRGRRH